jgi:hypothetical protein
VRSCVYAGRRRPSQAKLGVLRERSRVERLLVGLPSSTLITSTSLQD